MLAREVVFADHSEAGRRLADRLLHLKDQRPVVLALPRGGVPVGLEIARALDAPLDLVLVRKIGAPFQPELAVGAVVDGDRPETVLNQEIVRELQLPESYIAEQSARQLAEIERRRELYLAGWERAPVEGRTGDRGRRRHRHRRHHGGRAARYPPRQAQAPRAGDARSTTGYDRAAASPGGRGRVSGHAQPVPCHRGLLQGLPAGE